MCIYDVFPNLSSEMEPGEECSLVFVVLSFPWEIKLHIQSYKDRHLAQTEAQFYQSSTWWNQGVYWGFLREHR